MKRLNGLRVFYLDDDPNLLRLVEAYLSIAGAQVKTFERPRDALKALDSGPLPDLILCDILIPEMDGHNFHRTLRANAAWRSLPFIYVTAVDHDQEYRRSMNQGADGFLGKPFTKNQLLLEINHVLERRDELADIDPVVVRLLGTQQVRQGANLRSAPDRGAEGFVFHLLVEARPHPRPRQEVIRQLWGEITPSGFRSVLSRSRRWTDGWLDIVNRHDLLTVELKCNTSCDLDALTAALALGTGGAELERLYPGPLMPAYHDEWVINRREDLAAQVRARFVEDAETATSATERAAGFKRALSVDPYDLSLWEGYISALSKAGLRTEAEQASRDQRSFIG